MRRFKLLAFIFAIILFLHISSAFAQRGGVGSGSIKIQAMSANSRPLIIEISGTMFLSENLMGDLLLANLLPGDYFIKVTPYHRGKDRIMPIFNQNIRVASGMRTNISIGMNNTFNINLATDPNSVLLYPDNRDRRDIPDGKDRGIRPIGDKEFNQLLAELKKCSFDSDRMKLVELSAAYELYVSDQLGEVLKTFSFDDGRLQSSKVLIPKVIDPENLYLQAKLFTFNSNKDAFLELIRTRR